MSKILNPLQIPVHSFSDLAVNLLFLFIFMYFVFLLFITSPVLTASSLIYVTTYSVAVTDRPSISTSSAYAVYCLVLLDIVPFRLVSVFLITFPSTY